MVFRAVENIATGFDTQLIRYFIRCVEAKVTVFVRWQTKIEYR
ncbi:hypothetical protein MNBD_ALPHA05-1586 [hydrothermal vent metagenome]|uniref:Uncharacterized protein n=1 Tax=hydrothermal vent metagenome TaxID=652676 RepID=A0A3B0T307_9ZZZZ